MSTPISSASPFATAAQLLSRYDSRVVADLCTDSEYQPTDQNLLDPTHEAGIKLQTALADASGDIEAACLVGGRYTVGDLAALTGNGAASLQRLTCVLAMDYLAQRRANEGYQVSLQVQQAKNFLDALASGERIFGLQEVVDAGVPETEVETPGQVEARNLTTLIAGRLFGRRANRYTTF